MRYAVIMAGGAGRRLWPLSREHRPKQLLPLLEGKNLLEIAVERIQGIFEKENIWLITNAEYADIIAEALPELPRENIIGEPEGRDTANAIALAAELLAARDAEATMAVFTADHIIRPVEQFAEAVQKACETAEEHTDTLLTFGIRPTWPHTGLGYIECGETIADGVHKVLAFKEKPDHATARRYVDSGRYYWNSGMFVWKVGAIRSVLEQFLPDTVRKLAPVGRAVRDGGDFTVALKQAYPSLEKISIDFAVMEKAKKVLTVELNCEWLDIGSWPALEDVTSLDESDNVLIAKNAVLLDSFRNIVVTEGDHLLAVIGMDECIIVHSEDATLVCTKADAQRLKELVEQIEKKFGRKYT